MLTASFLSFHLPFILHLSQKAKIYSVEISLSQLSPPTVCVLTMLISFIVKSDFLFCIIFFIWKSFSIKFALN